MKTNIITVISAALLLTCCAKINALEGEHYSLTLRTEATKVAIGEKDGGSYPLTWQTGDAVIINGTMVSNGLGSEYDGQQSATFTTDEKVYYPVSVVYPATVKGENGNIVIPAEQTSGDSFANGCAILAGYSAGDDSAIQMAQTCGYIKVPVTGSQTLSSVSIKALGCEILAGTFSVNAKLGKIEPVAGEVGSSSIRVMSSETLSGTPRDFVFAVPAGSYAKGFRLTIKDNAGQQMTKTMYTATGKTIVAGMMTEMQPVAYTPSSAEAEIFDISTSEVSFTGKGYTAVSVSACAGGEDVTVSTAGLDWCKVTAPELIPAGMTTSIDIVPVNANICDVREGSVTFTGVTSGTKVVLPVSQGNMYTPSYGFPAKWYAPDFTTKMLNDWTEEGFFTCTAGAGVGHTYMTLGSTIPGRIPSRVIYNSKYPSGYGMVAGDYFQFNAPVQDVKAGTDLDLMITISPTAAGAPKYWLVEWYDGGEWKSNPRYTASEDGETKYSFYIKYFSSANYRTHIESYTLQNPVKDDFVRVRVRAVGLWNNGGGTLGNNSATVFLTPGTYLTYFVCYADEETPVLDTHKMSQYGNSITYYHGSAMMLKEIARREGHQLDVRINLKGSQEFENHLTTLPMSQEITAEGGYDFAVMNDGSYFHAEYAMGSKSSIVGVTAKYTPEEILYWQKEMTKAIRATSPNCQIVLTSEHSYSRKAADDNYLGFGSFENFDYYQWLGAQALATADPNLNWIAPSGKGFANARTNYGFTSAYNWMQHTDNYHPNLWGAYMRACITYLTMFGGSFGDNPADCCLDPADAAKLRQAAMDIVNDSTRENFHFHE